MTEARVPWRRPENRGDPIMNLGRVAAGSGWTIGRHWRATLAVLALIYAHRAAKQKADQRARSAVLLHLSQVLAEREDLVCRFLLLVREAFGADHAVIALDGAGSALAVDVDAPDTARSVPVPDYLRALLNLSEPAVVTAGLPPDIRFVLAVPVRTRDTVLGVTALAVRAGRRNRLSADDAALFAPLAGALAAAICGAQHFDRLTAETSKLNAIVHQSTEGIVVIDGAGNLQLHNQAFAELIALSSADIAGRRLVDLLEVRDRQDSALLLPVTPEQPKVPVEVTITRPDGQERHLRLAHSAVFDGDELARDVVVITDLTREYRAERMKSDFIATVSHELRTPLTPIIGYLDLLRHRGDRMSAEKRSAALDLIADRAAHMSRLVEDLLLASRVGDHDTEFSLQVFVDTHDLVAIARQVTDDLDSPRIVTDLPGHPVLVRCDPGRTVQVATNLVGNALKYSGPTGQVRVALRSHADRAVLEVVDHGPGIPAEHLEKVFEKFHRVEDPMTMRTGGTGLGLFIARRLAQAMGGGITLSSTVGVGSVFSFTLPIETPTGT
jgi:PAS domain S-box-containing protein